MNMTIRQIQAFVAVYRLGGISKAAKRLRLTQSAVSVLIRQIETKLGVTLFERTTRTLRPTQAAENAVADSERLLRDLDHLNAKFRGVAERTRGEVALALSAGLAAALGGVMLSAFARRYPNIKVHMHDVAPNQVVARVLEQAVEFGLSASERDNAEIEQEILATDQISAICLRSNKIARRGSMTWDQIAMLDTISTPRGDALRTLIDDGLARSNRHFEPKYEVSFLDTALAMAAQGIGIAVMPSHLVQHLHGRTLVGVPLIGPTLRRDLCLIYKADSALSPAAAAFAEVARDVLAASTGHGAASSGRTIARPAADRARKLWRVE
jgi:DNA-binding transcriptional LysR family regulator